MKEKISIFVDEAGDFGEYSDKCPYYLISMIFHDQENKIQDNLKILNEKLKNYGYEGHHLHTGPLIRREEEYKSLKMDDRKKIFMTFFTLFTKLDIGYKTFIVKREKDWSSEKMKKMVSQEIQDYFNGFDILKGKKIVVYYDNGQKQVTDIIKETFRLFDVEYKEKIRIKDYTLFQMADFVTTIELINYKKNTIGNSHSEKLFFGSINEFHKNYYKKVMKKRIDKDKTS